MAMMYSARFWHRNPNAHRFLFATGIEGSYPVITGPDGRDLRIDELASTGHYAHWSEDLQLVKDLGLECLRYGPPYYKTHLGPGRYDWAWTDETFGRLKELGITPIADLCHFGLPDWLGNFQNPDWPGHFATYAQAFAQRFPWVRFFTPVNELYVAAHFSARLGWWNERLQSERAFVTALSNAVRATLLAEEAILKVQPHAIFIQSESSEYFHALEPAAMSRAEFLNQRRFLSLDLCYGRDVSAGIYRYLLEEGMSPQDYAWFMNASAKVKPYCVMGNDYYPTNEHLVPVGDAPMVHHARILGYYVITMQYFKRYHLPVMHTETNQRDLPDAVAWLREQWAHMLRLKHDGVPIVGFTWYSLVDQIDWDTSLSQVRGTVNPLGLYNLQRQIRPVGEAYRQLVADWRDILPMESLSLDLTDCQH